MDDYDPAPRTCAGEDPVVPKCPRMSPGYPHSREQEDDCHCDGEGEDQAPSWLGALSLNNFEGQNALTRPDRPTAGVRGEHAERVDAGRYSWHREIEVPDAID